MRRRRRVAGTAAGLLLGGVLVAGCAAAAGGGTAAAGGQATPGGTITVLAAASLTGSFSELGARFEATHPGSRVRFSFGASSTLAQQIEDGAPADVFASASTGNMDDVVRAGEAGQPAAFAANRLQIAVPPDNPARVSSLADLARPGVKVAACQPQVPCGALARRVFDAAGVPVRPVTQAPDVKAVLTLVSTGEVDAGLVYVTDVRAAGGWVRGVAIPAGVNASTRYPIAPLRRSRNPATARAFVDFVLSAAGRAVLAEAGFAAP